MAESFFYTDPFASEFDVPTDFLGGVAVDREEQEEEGQQLNIPSNEGAPTLEILADILIGSGLLQKTIEFGTAAGAGAATGIGAGGTPVFNSTYNALVSAGATAAEATAAASQAAGATAAGESTVFGLNPITAAYLLYNVGRAVGKSISGQTDPNRFELTRLQNYDPKGAYKLKDKSVVQQNAALRDLASQLIELGWDSDRGIQQQLTTDNDPTKIQQFLELVLDNPLLTDFYTDVGYLADPEETKEFYNSIVEQGAEDTTAQDAAEVQAAREAAVESLTNPEDRQEVIDANNQAATSEVEAQEAADNVATVIEETNASVASAEGYANYMRSRYGPFSSNYKRAKAKADAAKLEAEREVDAARRKELEAQAEVENAKKAAAGALRDAEDAYKIERVNATRTAEADVQQRIAEQKEQNRIQRTTDTDGDGVYDFVDLFPDDSTEWQDSDKDGVGDVAQRLAQEQAAEAERERQRLEEEARKAREAEEEQEEVVVPVEPVPPPEEPPLEVAPPVVEQPVEEPTETTGSSGDEGTPAEPIVAQPTDVGEEQPTSTDIIAAQLREAIGAEEDPNVKEGLQLELDKWLSGGPTEYQTTPSGPPPPDVTGDFDVTDAVSWVARLTDYFKEQPASDLEIDPTDPLADDFPEVPLTGGPVAFDPVDPVDLVEDPVEPVEDPTGGAAETGVGAGDTGTGGGEGTGEGTGTGEGVGAGIGVGLTLGLASGMLKPQAVTDTLFKDIPFKRNYQAPEIIGAIEDLPTYKAPQVGLFQGII